MVSSGSAPPKVSVSDSRAVHAASTPPGISVHQASVALAKTIPSWTVRTSARAVIGRAGDLASSLRMICAAAPLREDGHRGRGDRLDLLGGALELLVGEHRRALEREVAVKL